MGGPGNPVLPNLGRLSQALGGGGGALRGSVRDLGAEPHMPPPAPGQFGRDVTAVEHRMRATRVNFAGGALNDVLTADNSITPFEQLYRRLPEEGIHSPAITPAQPFVLELGSFVVPAQMCVLIFDIRPDVYRFSGIDPNDAVPFEARRFGSQMGYSLKVDGKHPGDTHFELEPIRHQTGLGYTTQLDTDALFNPGTLPPAAAFVQARSNRFGASSGAGLALLPQRHFRYGPESLPLTLFLREKELISFEAVIFKPIQSPVAFFEMDMAGIIAPLNTMRDILNALSPKGEGY